MSLSTIPRTIPKDISLALSVIVALVIFSSLCEGNLNNAKANPGKMPRNLTVTEIGNGSYVITWQPPLEGADQVQNYEIKYRTVGTWRTLNRADSTHYLLSYLVPTRKYYFKVLAHSSKSYESSKVVKFTAPSKIYPRN